MIQLMKTFWEGMGANRHYKLVLDNSTVVIVLQFLSWLLPVNTGSYRALCMVSIVMSYDSTLKWWPTCNSQLYLADCFFCGFLFFGGGAGLFFALVLVMPFFLVVPRCIFWITICWYFMVELAWLIMSLIMHFTVFNIKCNTIEPVYLQ